jgi:hypothetical protein
MLRGPTTKRAPLDAAAIGAALPAEGVAQLRDEPSLGLILAGSDLRKPHAAEMAYRQRGKRLQGEGTGPGSPTLNVIGLGQARRGLLSHRLSSSAAPDFVSAPAAVRTAIRSGGTARAAPVAAGTDVTAIVDSGLDDQAIWGAIWAPGWSLVGRLGHATRWVRPRPDAPREPLTTVAQRLRP